MTRFGHFEGETIPPETIQNKTPTQLLQNESNDSYQVDPENIIGWDMLSDS